MEMSWFHKARRSSERSSSGRPNFRSVDGLTTPVDDRVIVVDPSETPGSDVVWMRLSVS
ncbi:hypothetical protein M6B38_226775 [Iris pallida]|uniref:Uncharacterized protein n=1 Tax=Iris pallida TaxID=29817 RepID=A0AAX6DUK9_IRIPA|nr:hypothetical protein M6B38_226775 [Iris pallida]